MTEAILLLACLVLVCAVAALARAVRRLQRRLVDLEQSLVTGASAPSSTNAPLVEEVAQRPSRDPVSEAPHEYVITSLGEEPGDEPVPALEPKLFADVVLRETVVKAASFAYGVRRGLSPENRNRMWFEMRRELRRARKQRRADERQAVREWKARQRAALHDGQPDGRPDGQREDDAA